MKEMQREQVLENLLRGELSVEESAYQLNLSERHIKRLKSGYLSNGRSYLIHGNRARKPSHALHEGVRKKVLKLVNEKYKNCNYHQIRELLEKEDKINLSISTVRRILKAAEIESSGKRGKVNKSSKVYEEGSSIVMDSKKELWHGLRRPKARLVLCVDPYTCRLLDGLMTAADSEEEYYKLIEQMKPNYKIDDYSFIENDIFVSDQDKEIKNKDFCMEKTWNQIRSWLIYELSIRDIRTVEETNIYIKSFIKQYNIKYHSNKRKTASGY